MRRRSPPPPRRRPGPRSPGPDDAAIDAIVDGGPVDAEHDRLATFARLVRTALLDVPDPHPSPDLTALLRGAPPSPSSSLPLTPSSDPASSSSTGPVGAAASMPEASPSASASEPVPTLVSVAVSDPRGSSARPRGGARRVAGLVARVAGLGVVAKIGLGASLAAASVTGAGAAGVLPASARDAVRDAIESVTPVDFEGTPTTGAAPSTPTTVAVASPGSELRLDPGGAADEGPVPPDSTRRDRADGRGRADEHRAGREAQRAEEREERDAPAGYGGSDGAGAAGDEIEHVDGGTGTPPDPGSGNAIGPGGQDGSGEDDDEEGVGDVDG